MNKKKILLALFVGLIGSFVISFNNSETVFAGKAQNVYDYINGKAKYQGVYNCYTVKYSSKHANQNYEVLGTIPSLDSVKKVSNILWYQNSSFSTYSGSGYFDQPYAETATKRCSTIFNSFSKKPASGNADSVKAFMEGLGYAPTGDTTNCYSLPFTKNDGKKTYYTNTICPDANGGYKAELNAGTGVGIYYDSVRGVCLTINDLPGNRCEKSGGLKKMINSTVTQKCGASGVCTTNKGVKIKFQSAKKQVQSSKAKIKGTREKAGSAAISYLSDKKKKLDTVKIDAIEKRLLYQAYLSKYYGVEVTCKKENKDFTDGKTIKWYTNGKIKTCYYSTAKAKHKDKPVNYVNGDGFLKKSSSKSGITGMNDLIIKIGKLKTDYSQKALDKAAKIVGGSASEDGEDDGGGEDDIEELCNQAGLKGLSWVACPVMSSTEETVSGLDAMIGSWLNVDTDLYKTDSPTYQVWEIMRNIANVALVIVLLVIIFSQLTGVGVDNYGIKKMLPRLIAMAILVNLSYLACQLVIDLSNILGVSLNTLFRGIGDSVTPNAASLIGEGFISGIIASLFGAAGIAGAGAGTAATLISIIGPAGTTAAAAGGAVLSAPLVVVVILLALIPVLLAVLLFFLMLGARMILVIICTAVAPVVCVLYILPNTQKWAKKWWNLFFAMLVMYPICGAIAGISYLIKAMVLNMDGVHLWMAVVAMVGPFLPFFLLPTLLKNAISALGNVGGALMTMGNKVTSGAGNIRSAIEKSDRYQDAMKYSQNEASGARAKKIADALANKKNRTAAEDMRYAQAEARYAAYTNTKDKAYKEINDHKSLGDVEDDARNAIANKDWTRLNADLLSMEDKGEAGHVFKMLGESLDAESLNALRENDGRSYDYLMQGLNKSSSDVEKGFAKYRMSGGSAGFDDWVKGRFSKEQKDADDKAGIKSEFTSYADYLKSRGTGAMNNYTKDEMEFVKDNAKALRENMGEAFGNTVGSALVSSGDARAQTQAEEILTEQIAANDGLEASSLGLTAESLGSMRSATAEALEQGYMKRGMTKEQARNTIRSQLAEQIATAQSDPRIMSSMNQSVKDMLGIDGTSTGSAGAGAGSSGAGASTTGASGGSEVPPSGAAREGEEFSVHNPSRPVVDANDYVDYQQGSPLPKEPAKNSNAHDQYRPVTDPNDFIDYQQGR